MFPRFVNFRRESSNAVVLAREERESTMSPSQRDGEGRNVSLAKDVFLCHSGKQKIPVREPHKDLTNKGVSCFFDEDPQSLPVGEKFPSRIFEAAEKCRIAVLVLSKDFIHSKWPMQELSAFLKAKSSGKNPHMKILPLFFMISPKSLSEIRAEWHGALREIRSIKGLVFKEVEEVVGFTAKVVKAICSLLLPHIPSSMQGQERHDQDRLKLQCKTSNQHDMLLSSDLQAAFPAKVGIVLTRELWILINCDKFICLKAIRCSVLVFFSILVCCSNLHQQKKWAYIKVTKLGNDRIVSLA